MLVDVIRSLYQYNEWANHRLLKAASTLTCEQFLAAPHGNASVRDTLVHTMSAEWIWLSRWRGTSPRVMFEPTAFGDLQAIQTGWKPVEAETQQFIKQLVPSRLAEVVSYVNTGGEKWAYPLWQQMIHQVNHATQHRSEVATMLTSFDASPGDLDYLVYLDGLSS